MIVANKVIKAKYLQGDICFIFLFSIGDINWIQLLYVDLRQSGSVCFRYT